MQPISSKTSKDLAGFIQQNAISAELVYPREATPTVPLAAQAMGCQPDQIIKSVLFIVKGAAPLTAALVIANGMTPIDFRKLAAVFEVGRRRIRLATAEEVLAVTGYAVGGVPPFGFDQTLATFIDRGVMAWPEVFGGGGDDRTLLRITPNELVRATGGQLIEAR
ncbi:MAG: YbaK/EbsC family protein [Anaerolineae bacterium]|nr:YbaK/EbsC family protein [Anaerolineae bacterium]MCB0198714.1 YbaK/EbsC family protein [Anaerolineae bacterium]MCB0203463.1 YbaK/EbsC family protein [Anaerolineae bacterium]MCB0253353.1 YbaK/EbsC family protein [Anaerolineae bacterium]